ncbi:uncharacterized protein LOC141854213 [Brevipalpus obovatus]|uniref:uncharacterized protein LOC141854213 n=1 Tax=Brevipalpus obovatus TaxID=246614 RepID=UPI003D9DE4F1
MSVVEKNIAFLAIVNSFINRRISLYFRRNGIRKKLSRLKCLESQRTIFSSCNIKIAIVINESELSTDDRSLSSNIIGIANKALVLKWLEGSLKVIKESDILLKISFCKQSDVTLVSHDGEWCQLIVSKNIDFYSGLINFYDQDDDGEWPHYVDIFGKKDILFIATFLCIFGDDSISLHNFFPTLHADRTTPQSFTHNRTRASESLFNETNNKQNLD